MDGQAHRGRGDNVAGDQTKIKLQINQSAGSSYIGNQYLPPAEKPIPHHLTSTPFIPDVFQGRDADLAAIRATLEIGNKPLLLVNGEGGIGKTSLAARYWQRYKDEYKHTAWLYAPSRLDDALLSLAKALKVTFPDTMPTEQRLEELQRAIANLPEFCLFIIDNANNAKELAAQWGFLGKCSNCHILLTSRINSFNNAGCYRVEALSEADALSVFKIHYRLHRTEDDGLFGSIYQAVGGNTLVLMLLAKNLAAVNDNSVIYSLSQLLKDLQRHGLLRLSKTKPVQIMGKGSQPALETVDPTEIIAALYDDLEQIKPLSEIEQWLLCNLAVLPAENLAYGYLAKLLFMVGDKDTEEVFSDILSGLAKRGWLERSHQDGISHYKISPVVQEITRHKNLGRLQGHCEGLIDKLTEKLAYQANIGILLNVNDAEEAATYCRHAEIVIACNLPRDHSLGILCDRIGRYHLTAGNSDKALKYFTFFYNIMTALHQCDLNDMDVKSSLAVASQYLGYNYFMLGDLTQALLRFKEYYHLRNELYTDRPSHPKFKSCLAIACQHLGNTYSSLGDFKQALHWRIEDYKLSKELYYAEIKNLESKHHLAISCQNLGTTYISLGNPNHALRYFEEHYRLEQEIHATAPNDLDFKNQLALACQYLGDTCAMQENTKQALHWFERHYNLALELHDVAPNHLDFKNSVAFACQNLGNIYAKQDKPEQALCWFKKFHHLAQEHYTASPDHLDTKNSLAISLNKLGQHYEQQGNLSSALDYYRQAQALWMELVAKSPLYVEFKERLGWLNRHLEALDT